MKPRVLIAGGTRYAVPLSPPLRRKFEALAEQLDFRVLARGRADDPRFRLFPGTSGAAFWALLPLRIARELRGFRPAALLAQSPYEAAAALLARRLARVPAAVVLDVHGDWRTFTRLYGSPLRRIVSRPADALAAWAVRRADAVRPVSPYTERLVRELGVEPAATFPAFMDLDPFLGPVVPLPERPVALFVGVLERYKNVDGLLEAWRLASARLPEAELRIVGRGSLEPLVARNTLSRGLSWTPQLPTEGVASALDAASLLVLPSRSEGMGRIVVEALLRGRPVLATAVGGITDLVRDGVNGVLVGSTEPQELADALVAALSDRALLERLAAAARPSVESMLATPEQYAARLRELVDGLDLSP
ncbi:MAG TPA: glycosyltransferase family 4 protein [Gaiellaceae bacterium]